MHLNASRFFHVPVIANWRKNIKNAQAINSDNAVDSEVPKVAVVENSKTVLDNQTQTSRENINEE